MKFACSHQPHACFESLIGCPNVHLRHIHAVSLFLCQISILAGIDLLRDASCAFRLQISSHMALCSLKSDEHITHSFSLVKQIPLFTGNSKASKCCVSVQLSPLVSVKAGVGAQVIYIRAYQALHTLSMLHRILLVHPVSTHFRKLCRFKSTSRPKLPKDDLSKANCRGYLIFLRHTNYASHSLIACLCSCFQSRLDVFFPSFRCRGTSTCRVCSVLICTSYRPAQELVPKEIPSRPFAYSCDMVTRQ